MAAWRVGMRVKLVSQVASDGFVHDQLAPEAPVGAEGVIVLILDEPDEWECIVDYPDFPAGGGDPTLALTEYYADFCMLAPLTDPSADQFIARIKKLGSEPINDAPKVTVREGK